MLYHFKRQLHQKQKRTRLSPLKEVIPPQRTNSRQHLSTNSCSLIPTMRLLDTTSFQLKEFVGDKIPKYAILSHTWGEEEVSFQEVNARQSNIATRAGYRKILNSCALAKKYDLQFIWIDTCCIDKTSSAELSEAINSMFRWYAKAEECYAYLEDILLPSDGASAPKKFVDSKWFTRGWTLQELLAPERVIFFDSKWREIGNKPSLRSYISSTTGISSQHLHFSLNGGDFERVSIATRMSWASRRKTTREEDIAYCLLGVFNINMPLLYGEGKRAFLRLQEELIKKQSDESIYAWEAPPLVPRLGGMLASEPAEFTGSATIVPINLSIMRREPLSITNRGLAMSVAARKGGLGEYHVEGDRCFEVPLACADMKDTKAPLMLYLGTLGNGNACRMRTSHFHFGVNMQPADFTFINFYVPLVWPLSNPWKDYIGYTKSESMLDIRISSAAQLCLSLLESNISGGELSSVFPGTFVWHRAINSAYHLMLKFRYIGGKLIYLIWIDWPWKRPWESILFPFSLNHDMLGLRIGESDKPDFTKTPTFNNTAPRDISRRIDNKARGTNNHDIFPNQYFQADCNGDAESSRARKLDSEFTFIEKSEPYTTQLERGQSLWVSTKRLPGSSKREHVLVEIDISSIDRQQLF